MKKITHFFLIALLIGLINFNSYSQNCEIECPDLIENPTLELTYEGTAPIVVHGAFLPQNNWVVPWLASTGSPHLAFINEFDVCWTATWDPASQFPLFNCLATNYTISEDRGYMEGIMQNVAFNGDGHTEYCITVNANYIDCIVNEPPPMHFVLRAANNLIWDIDYMTTLPFVIPGNDAFEIQTFEITDFNPTNYSATFFPQNDFNLFEIVAILEPADIDMNGQDFQSKNMTINDVSITCETTSLTDFIMK